MQPYFVRNGRIPPEKLALFGKLVQDFRALPDLDPPSAIASYTVCRVLAARHPQARCVDGFFVREDQNHCWLDLGGCILADIYPVAGANPFLVEVNYLGSPWRGLYQEKPNLFKTLLPDHQKFINDSVEALLQGFKSSPAELTKTLYLENT